MTLDHHHKQPWQVPLLYLLFDDLNPALAKRCPALSEALDNVVVFVLPGDIANLKISNANCIFSFFLSLHHLRDRLVGNWDGLVDRGDPGPGGVRQDDPRVLHGRRHQLLDPHPHPPPLHALSLLHKDLPFPRTLHVLEHHEGIFVVKVFLLVVVVSAAGVFFLVYCIGHFLDKSWNIMKVFFL